MARHAGLHTLQSTLQALTGAPNIAASSGQDEDRQNACLCSTSACSCCIQLPELPTAGGHLKPPALSANDGWAADLDDGGDRWQDMDAQSPGSAQSDATSTGWLCCLIVHTALCTLKWHGGPCLRLALRPACRTWASLQVANVT